MATINYMSNAATEFEALVDQPFDLKSPSRSTAPLLAYWADFDARLAQFGDALQLPIHSDAKITFEYTVSPSAGRGKASHTDLMIRSSSAAIAVEAKYTEGKYPIVSKWLGTTPEQNKVLVLGSWLEAINQATGSKLTINLVKDIAYQLIHRTASACTPAAATRAVVYHYFDPVDDRRKYYMRQLGALASLIAAPERISFFLYMTTLAKTTAYSDLQAQWLKNRSVGYSREVRKLLKARALANFSMPVIVKCHHTLQILDS